MCVCKMVNTLKIRSKDSYLSMTNPLTSLAIQMWGKTVLKYKPNEQVEKQRSTAMQKSIIVSYEFTTEDKGYMIVRRGREIANVLKGTEASELYKSLVGEEPVFGGSSKAGDENE